MRKFIIPLIVFLCLFLCIGNVGVCAQEFGNKDDIVISDSIGIPDKRVSGNSPASPPLISSIHCDRLYPKDGNLFQDIYFVSQQDSKINIQLDFFKQNGTSDSTIIYSIIGKSFEASKGVNSITIPFKDRRVITNIKEDWLRAFKSIERLPVGNYSCIIQIESADNGNNGTFVQTVLFSRDTLIKEQNKLNAGLNKIFGSNKATIARTLDNKQPRLDRYYRKKGITCNRRSEGGKELLDLYCGDWYLGRKELPSDIPAGQFAQTQDALKNNAGATGKDGFSSYQSLLSQFRDMQSAGRENTELVADLSLAGNFSNGQEPGSGQDNNYYEGKVDIEMPLFDIPIQVSGFYTTQDRNRQAKASYLHFRYDAEKAKEQMMKLIAGFNSKYSNATTKGSAYDMIYGGFVDQLQKEKDNALTKFTQEYGIDQNGFAALDENKLQQLAIARAEAAGSKLVDSAQNAADTSSLANNAMGKKDKALAAKQQAEEKYRKAQEQYQKIQALQQKIDKYKGLLEQYRKTNFYDSALAYGKVKDLQHYENMSYKDMAKSASALLPESKTKGAITGLVNFDAGMFPKYVSDYTIQRYHQQVHDGNADEVGNAMGGQLL